MSGKGEKYDQDELTIVRGHLEPWAFTCKMLGAKLPTYEDYVPIIEAYQSTGLVKTISQERDSRGRLHIHGILLLRKGFFRKQLCKKGFHTKLEFMYNEQGWVDYINKSQLRLRFDDYDTNAKAYHKFYLFGKETVEV